MNYNLKITPKAEWDLNSAADYIEFTLLNPQAADNLLSKAEEAISKLSYMPKAHSLVNDPILNVWGIRFIPVNNYIVFCTIDERSKTVYMIRFLYSKRSWIVVFKNDLH